MPCGAATRLLCPTTTVASTASTPGAANACNTGFKSPIRYGGSSSARLTAPAERVSQATASGAMDPGRVSIARVIHIVLQLPALAGVTLHKIDPRRAPAQRFDAQAAGAGKQVHSTHAFDSNGFQNVKYGGADPFSSGSDTRDYGAF